MNFPISSNNSFSFGLMLMA